MSAEAQAVAQSVLHLHLTAHIRHIVQIALRVGLLVVDGGRRELVAEGQCGEHGLDAACAAQQMAGHALGADDGDVLGVVAEDGVDSGSLAAVVHVGAGAVGVDVVDLLGGNAAVLESQLHAADGACAAGCGSREVVGVAVGAVAHDFGIDVCAAGPGVLQLFQHQHTAALAHHKAAAPCVEGQAGCIRVRSSGESLHAGKAADAQRADAALGTAADHDRLVAVADAVERIAHSVGAACAGGTNAVGDAFHRIRDGYEPVMVCGGAESCISPLGIGGFTSMKALSTAADPDAASLPFDARRGGFVMGEGSGVLVLEELEHARARGAHIYAEVVGYGANCDAYHFTAPAPGGAGAIGCMKLTLKDGGIAPEQIDHINAHGTGTHMNDSCETAAIHAVFGDHAKDIAVVSTKSMTGHLLGGAGGIEAVFTALALRDQFAPPTIHYEQPDPECDLDYVPNVGREMKMEYALSNSLGFGGHNACLAFKKWEG